MLALAASEKQDLPQTLMHEKQYEPYTIPSLQQVFWARRYSRKTEFHRAHCEGINSQSPGAHCSQV